VASLQREHQDPDPIGKESNHDRERELNLNSIPHVPPCEFGAPCASCRDILSAPGRRLPSPTPSAQAANPTQKITVGLHSTQVSVNPTQPSHQPIHIPIPAIPPTPRIL